MIDKIKKYPAFSVAMSVYKNDDPKGFDEALQSIWKQTVQPSEIVLVVDGPISKELDTVIEKYQDVYSVQGIIFLVIRFEKNQGHGNARRCGVENCNNELIALMDADDICVFNRFEQQLRFFIENDVDVVGGDIAEFIENCENIVAYRMVPVEEQGIKTYMKARCPFNQVTVMFKKSKVLNAGGYLDWYCDEDYYLWIRMFLNDARFANTGTVLVNVRVGDEMYERRGGLKYFKSEIKLQRYMLNNGIIGISTYAVNVLKRLIVQILMPNCLRGWVFRNFARTKKQRK